MARMENKVIMEEATRGLLKAADTGQGLLAPFTKGAQKFMGGMHHVYGLDSTPYHA